jgi:hypothetical protein
MKTPPASDTSKPSDQVLADLRSVFEGIAGMVMTSTDSISRELVTRIVKEFPLEETLRDLGVVAARELANHIESKGLRPAAYAELPNLSEIISERLMQELGKEPQVFTDAFLVQLRARG